MKNKSIIQRMIVSTIPVGIITVLGISSAFATGGVDSITVNLPTSCTIESINNTHTETLINNTYDDNVGNGVTTFTTYCNDAGGYVVYAIGSSGNVEGNTNLIGDTGANIATGIMTSGNTSNWAFRIKPLGENNLTMNPTYTNGDNFASIPSHWDWVAKKESGTVDITTGSKITAQYAAYISGTQRNGTYTGQVKYIMINPSTASAPEGIDSIVYMQEFASLTPAEKASLMDTMIEDQQYQLRDIRDNKLYWVAKLKDGNVWMTENLDLDLSTERTLTSNDTDLNLYGSYNYNSNNGYTCSNSSDNCENGTISWIPERNTIASDNLNSTTWINDSSNPYSYQGTEGECPNNPSPDCNDGHSYANNYYNWTAAIASNNSSLYTANNTVAANSICPAGWKLPNAAPIVGGYEFSKLLYAYDITNDDTNGVGYANGGFGRIIDNPLWFARGGIVDGGNLNDLSVSGYYWSGVAYNGTLARRFRFNSTEVSPGGTSSRYLGFPVRCVSR